MLEPLGDMYACMHGVGVVGHDHACMRANIRVRKSCAFNQVKIFELGEHIKGQSNFRLSILSLSVTKHMRLLLAFGPKRTPAPYV